MISFGPHCPTYFNSIRVIPAISNDAAVSGDPIQSQMILQYRAAPAVSAGVTRDVSDDARRLWDDERVWLESD